MKLWNDLYIVRKKMVEILVLCHQPKNSLSYIHSLFAQCLARKCNVLWKGWCSLFFFFWNVVEIYPEFLIEKELWQPPSKRVAHGKCWTRVRWNVCILCNMIFLWKIIPLSNLKSITIVIWIDKGGQHWKMKTYHFTWLLS